MGYSPPVRTQKMTLPQDFIPRMAVAITDSVAEGRDAVALMSGLDNLTMMFGGEQTAIASKGDSRVLSCIITLWEESETMHPKYAASSEALLGFIQRWSDTDERSRPEIAPGEVNSELRAWYKILQGYIDIENIDGAMCVWRELHRCLSIPIPENYSLYTPSWEEAMKQRMKAHYFHHLGPSDHFLACPIRVNKQDLRYHCLVLQVTFPSLPSQSTCTISPYYPTTSCPSRSS